MFSNLKDALKLEIIPPEENPRVKEFYKNNERFNDVAKKMGVRLILNEKRSISIHPPLSAACALMDPARIYEYMYTQPEGLRKFLDKMYLAFVTYKDYFNRIYRVPSTGQDFGLADDNISFISCEAFRQWEMPYYLKFKEKYKPQSFYLHSDGPNDQHFGPLANEAGITSMDIGGFSSLEEAVSKMKGKVYIHGGLNCKDFYNKGRMSEVTKAKAINAIKLAAPGGGFELAIGGECYIGVSPEGIRDAVCLIEKYGKYPIQV